jgi:hypothetical protein
VRTRIRSGAGEPGGPRRPSLATLVFRQWGRSGSARRDRLEIRRLCLDPRQEPHRVIDQDARRPGDRDILIEQEQLSLDRAERGRARPSSGGGRGALQDPDVPQQRRRPGHALGARDAAVGGRSAGGWATLAGASDPRAGVSPSGSCSWVRRAGSRRGWHGTFRFRPPGSRRRPRCRTGGRPASPSCHPSGRASWCPW